MHWQQANVQLPKVKQEKGGLKRVESNRFQQKPSLPPLVRYRYIIIFRDRYNVHVLINK